jgi:hypothetical protein
MKTPHTSTYKGKRVYVRLKSGERIVGRFEEKVDKYIWIDGRKIPKGDIKAFAIYRGNERESRNILQNGI